MVKDSHNKVYSELMDFLKEKYPKIEGSTEYNEDAPHFPYVYFSL